MSATQIVKVQTSAHGTGIKGNVLIYAKGHFGLREQRMPKLADEMGHASKRYYYASRDQKGEWVLGARAPTQDW